MREYIHFMAHEIFFSLRNTIFQSAEKRWREYSGPQKSQELSLLAVKELPESENKELRFKNFQTLWGFLPHSSNAVTASIVLDGV